MSPTRSYGRRRVEVTSLDRVYYPEAGVTKEDVLDYYERVAEVMLPHLEDRPLSLQRFPEGLAGDGFYQKGVPEHFPDWIGRAEVALKDGGTQPQVVVRDVATLIWLAQHGTLTFHAWLSRAPELHSPDRMVVDLDPEAEGDFDSVRRAARDVRALFEEAGLAPFLMVTGSKGLHLWAPLRPGPDFDEVRAFARELTEHLAAEHPDRYTTEIRKKKRRGRLFLDVARNAYAQTAVAPYSLRPRPGAPVATPLEWDELGSLEGPRRWTLRSVPRRLAHRDDPWKGMGRRAVTLEAARSRWARARSS